MCLVYLNYPYNRKQIVRTMQTFNMIFKWDVSRTFKANLSKYAYNIKIKFYVYGKIMDR